MKSQIARLASLVTISLVFAGAPIASADTDPFPSIALGAEIPGTRVSGQQEITCPTGSSRGILVQIGTGEFTVCNKSWRPQSEIDADAAFRQAQVDATASAEAESKAWAQAHPGQQKCIQWGPIVHANGVSTASGGVCANPVPVPSGSQQETSTVSSTPSQETTTSSAPTPTPSPTPSSTPAPVNTNGFGGYAVIHPDGHVCGVIVSNSNDPFNNGGVMPQEYMGCPSGSRIVFQSAPSESGNVAGWHGENVRLNGDTYSLPGGSTISGGIVTDTNGRTWNSGTGQTITPGVVDSRTVLSDTTTVLSDTSTVLSETSTVSVETATALAIPMAIALPLTTSADTTTPTDDLDSLPEVDAEEEISHSIDARVVSNKTRIDVSTAWESTRLSIVATKKGSKKKYTYRFSTDASGNYLFKSSINLKGFTLVLYKGAEELVREVV
jgi:hypothetical protein